MQKNIIIADNQAVTAAGLSHYIGLIEGIEQLYHANHRKRLIELLSGLPEAIVVIDYTLFDFHSVAELLILQERFPDSMWLLFSESLSDEFLRQIIYGSSSCGIILKSCTENEILMALHCAIHSERYICNRVSNQLLLSKRNKKTSSESILTPTEKAILKEIAWGKTTKEIAAKRNASIHTIITHRKNIFRKIEVNNLHEATRYAIRAGIIDMAEYYI